MGVGKDEYPISNTQCPTDEGLKIPLYLCPSGYKGGSRGIFIDNWWMI